MKSLLVFFTLLLASYSAIASQPLSENSKGLYYLGTAERGKTQKNIGIGDLKGTPVVGVSDCKKGCPMALYQYQEKESQETGKTIYFGAGLYLIEYDSESLIMVMPNSKLGHKPWTSFKFSNIYSKNSQKAKATSKSEIENFAKQISSKLFEQPVGKMKHAGGTYYLAVPQAHMGKSQRSYQISFNKQGKKSIGIKPCDRCSEKTYQLLPKESGIIGTEVYRYASSDYLFDLKDGVLVYTFANASGLGKKEWGKNSHYNVYSNNEKYVRQLITDKSKQDAIDKTLTTYFKQVKSSFEKEADAKRQKDIANRKLPKSGYKNNKQKQQALKASKSWANSWGWKENITDVYFTSNDWAATRNPLTGITTGRVIRGIITMKHPDGRCRYQHSAYRQDYDGKKYFNLHMTGVGPIYDLKCDKL